VRTTVDDGRLGAEGLDAVVVLTTPEAVEALRIVRRRG